ncbi:hypothetical protein LCGC14_2663380, partial [marine sediment metagenome]
LHPLLVVPQDSAGKEPLMIVGHPRNLITAMEGTCIRVPFSFRCRGRIYRRVIPEPYDTPHLDGVVWVRFGSGVDGSVAYVLYETKQATGAGRYVSILYEWQPGGARPLKAGFGKPAVVAGRMAA